MKNEFKRTNVKINLREFFSQQFFREINNSVGRESDAKK